MRVLLLGATGRIGRVALGAALRADHSVVALVRQPGPIEQHERLEVMQGGIQDAAVVRWAVDGVAAVISAVGPRTNAPEAEEELVAGIRNVVEAMASAGTSRLVTLSGAGVDIPGDRKPIIDRAMSRVVRRLARHVVGAKQREYEIIAASTLQWTALRPRLVRDGTATGYRLDLALRPGARVTRSDVGQALVDQLTDRNWIHRAPFVLPASR